MPAHPPPTPARDREQPGLWPLRGRDPARAAGHPVHPEPPRRGACCFGGRAGAASAPGGGGGRGGGGGGGGGGASARRGHARARASAVSPSLPPPSPPPTPLSPTPPSRSHPGVPRRLEARGCHHEARPQGLQGARARARSGGPIPVPRGVCPRGIVAVARAPGQQLCGSFAEKGAFGAPVHRFRCLPRNPHAPRRPGALPPPLPAHPQDYFSKVN
jgi:hypothetical protein